ncbi:uncharacterized protein LOC117170074 [Belonocnema kinseyi]|uniref:uncharacterized protein LOC117170074 n=1 Tax=Belonocnema kinseyi TaxID=2817044 RepID=UPI00143D6E6E|nr:uncharacterized protein LOC117170074 [Belonocnema kinseyi]
MMEMEEKAKTEALYERFRSTFNKLTPQKFDSLLSQFRSLQIDTQEKMEGVVNLVFEMAISEPDSCVAYALMCKELALMQVSGTNPRDSSATNFRKLIVTRCQREFEKDSENAKLRETKAKEIEECIDLGEKQNLKMILEEEEKKMRNRSVGNIRFIGELFKLEMLSKNIMHFCIGYMLDHRNEENLECLCKLLTSVGKNLEEIDQDLESSFKVIQGIINNEGPGKISSDVCKMLQELIELRKNKWESKNLETDNQIEDHDGISASKGSGAIHKYSEIRKMWMQPSETVNLPNEPSSLNVNDSEPRPKSPESLISTFSISQNEQRKDIDSFKQPRPRSKKIPNRERRNFKSSFDNLEPEDQTKLESLYKEILRIPDTSAPQKLENLIVQGRSLQSASQQRLLEIVEFIFEKATKEPSFSCACAFLCKELEFISVTDPNLNDEDANKFGRVIVTRCKVEFEKNSQIDKSKESKVKEIEECTNSEKKQELQNLLEEDEKEKRIKSLGNMRFIGELFKQRMLNKLIMHGIIKHLLQHKSDMNLESVCTLLTTIGKNLETNDDLKGYFEEMQKIINDNCVGEISLKVLNVIKELIELRKNKWISGVNDDNPKASDENDNTVETPDLENKSPSVDEIQFESASTSLNNISSDLEKSVSLPLSESKSTEFGESGTSDEKSFEENRHLQNGNSENCSAGDKSGKSKAELMYILNGIVEEYIDKANNDDILVEIKKNFSSSNLSMLVYEIIYAVIKKSKNAREKISKLLSFLVSKKVITLKDFREGFGQILGMFDVLVNENSQIRTCFAEILLYLVIEETHPISELKTTLESLRIKGESGKLVAKLFSKMSEISGSKSTGEKWRQSGLQVKDIIDTEREQIDRIVKNYKLEFLLNDGENLESNISSNGSLEVSTDEIKSNQNGDRDEPVNRSRKYFFKTSNLKNKSLSANRKNSNFNTKNSESLLKSASSSNQHEQTNSTNKTFFFKKQGWRIRNQQKQRKSAYDNLSAEEKAKVEILYKEMFRETNGSESQNFDFLIDIGKTLKSESPKRLREIVKLLFEKATQEPSFSSACAFMCKEFFYARVFNPDNKTTESLKPLIISRSQSECEKYSLEEIAKIGKLQMQIRIELARLGKLQLQLEEEEKKLETNSATNVKFIGELFKQGVLTTKDLKKLQESKEAYENANYQDSVDQNSNIVLKRPFGRPQVPPYDQIYVRQLGPYLAPSVAPQAYPPAYQAYPLGPSAPVGPPGGPPAYSRRIGPYLVAATPPPGYQLGPPGGPQVPSYYQVGQHAALVSPAMGFPSSGSISTSRGVIQFHEDDEMFYRRVQILLSVLPLRKIDAIAANFKLMLAIDSQERLQGVVDIVHKAAIEESALDSWPEMYALLVKEIFTLPVSGTADKSQANFLKLIVGRCQAEFDSYLENDYLNDLKSNEIDSSDSEAEEAFQELLEENMKMQMKFIRNIRFMGKLFKHGLLPPSIMIACLKRLLEQKEEESFECLHTLLTESGQKLEANEELNGVFEQIQKILNQNRSSKRVLFLFQDLVNLRANNWVSRKKETGGIEGSPKNRVYSRDFLMKLQKDPNSKVKPVNLPDLDVVLDSTKVQQPTSRSPSQMRPKIITIRRVEEVKLRESDNPWKPSRLAVSDIPEDDAVTQTLNKHVSWLLNKLTLEKFERLVSRIHLLKIDTKKKMDGVINLVFEKAIDEPNFCVAYALMCKELVLKQESIAEDFKNCLITRCQSEFEKNHINEKFRETMKARELQKCADAEEKNELQARYEEEERRIRLKSVNTIRLIGELFKQGLLPRELMHFYINHLLQHRDEENLECLCKLLETIGKDLETDDDFEGYIEVMKIILIDMRLDKISYRLLSMIQNVISLSSSKWMPKRGTNNPRKVLINKMNVITLQNDNVDSHLRFNHCSSENAWKPKRLEAENIPEDEVVTQNLYKKVRSVLNKLTPQKFDTLVSQVRALAIDTKERMDGVINLVFEKAIDEPSFSVAYQHRDEENLECLCKLLSTIGKNLETNDNLKDYFKIMDSIVNDKGPNKISSRVRFMIQDVIDLRSNKWVPRKDDSNPKTMDQIQRDAESERLDARFNHYLNLSFDVPRKDGRGGDRRRNISKTKKLEGTRTTYSPATSKLNNKPAIPESNSPRSPELYALIVKEIIKMPVTGTSDFLKVILDMCQAEFDSYFKKEDLKSIKVKKIEECVDPEKKQELQELLEEEEVKKRMISIRNIWFMGELFKHGVLPPPMMIACLKRLLEQKDDDSLEFLHKLIVEFGEKLEIAEELNDVFEQMQKIINEKGSTKKVRSLFQDVINMRASNCASRKNENILKFAINIPENAEAEEFDWQLEYLRLDDLSKDIFNP